MSLTYIEERLLSVTESPQSVSGTKLVPNNEVVLQLIRCRGNEFVQRLRVDGLPISAAFSKAPLDESVYAVVEKKATAAIERTLTNEHLAILERGGWLTLLRAAHPGRFRKKLTSLGISKSEANRAINTFLQFGDEKFRSHIKQITPTALAKLAAPSVHQEVRDEAIRRAKSERITIKIADELIGEQKQLRDPTGQNERSSFDGEDIRDSLTALIDARQRFATIYADPPWRYSNVRSNGAAENHYPTMSLDEICRLPVQSVGAEDCLVHLWVPTPLLPEGLECLRAWGLDYKSAFVWVKSQMGCGNYWRVSHEFLLLGVRGKQTFRRKDLRSWCELPRSGQHSQKPDPVRALIAEASPGPYLELFGKKEVPGWTVLGNEVSAPTIHTEQVSSALALEQVLNELEPS